MPNVCSMAVNVGELEVGGGEFHFKGNFAERDRGDKERGGTNTCQALGRNEEHGMCVPSRVLCCKLFSCFIVGAALSKLQAF